MPTLSIMETSKMSVTDFIKRAMELHKDVEFENYVDLIPELDESTDSSDLDDALCLDALYTLPNGRQIKFGAWNGQIGTFWPDEDNS